MEAEVLQTSPNLLMVLVPSQGSMEAVTLQAGHCSNPESAPVARVSACVRSPPSFFAPGLGPACFGSGTLSGLSAFFSTSSWSSCSSCLTYRYTWKHLTTLISSPRLRCYDVAWQRLLQACLEHACRLRALMSWTSHGGRHM